MPEAIAIKNLYKKYPHTTAVDRITFSVQEGEFFGLLGPNGAGKTTTIHILTGLANKTSGNVQLFGKDVVDDYQEARALIGLVPQEFNFDAFEKVYNVLYYSAGYFNIPRRERHSKIKKILTELDLWHKKDEQARTLSGGMKRKLMIGRALVHNPKILILDEPTAGVDVETRKSMWKYIQSLNSKGMTILLTTHYLEEAEALCERIAIINEGKIVRLAPKEELLGLLEWESVYITLTQAITTVPEPLKAYNPTLNKNSITFRLNMQETSWENFLKDLLAANLPLDKIETQQNKLEDIFIELTKK